MKQDAEQKTDSGFKHEFFKANISDLVPHEGILDWHLKEIKDWIEKDGFQLRPIAVSRLDHLGGKWKGRLLIHDGHHRTAALTALGCSKIMVGVFDYFDPRIKVFGYYDTSVVIPKEEVVQKAILGRDITPRYDKHFIDVNGELVQFHDNDEFEPQMPTKLSELK